MTLVPLRGWRFTRDHRWVPGQLSALLDGELGPRSVRRVERHLTRCPQCRAVLRGLERTLRLLQRLAAPHESPPDLATAVRRRLHESPPDSRAATRPG